MKHTVSLFGVLALVGVLMLPSHAVLADETKTNTATTTTAAPSVIGNVTYLLGQADMTLRDGTIVPITPQTDILDGSTVSVKDRSKLNLKMVDGEIAKMPANSALRFTTYQYNPANPAASKVSKEIIEGDVTTKTGEAGHYAPTRYRLNSPLAAIAVLGTEYTVQVRADETRVTVIAGKISMAKLGGACMRSGLGECAGGERLSENQRGLALIVLKDQPRPVLIPAAAAAPAQSQVQAAPAAEPSKADEKTADKSADQSTDKKADKQEVAVAPATTDDKSAASVTSKASDKSTERVTENVTDKTVASTSDKKSGDSVTSAKTVDERDPLAELVSTPKTVTSNASTPSTTTTTTITKVDERDPLAEPVVVEVKKTTSAPVVAVVVPIETNTNAATPVVTQVAVNTVSSGTSTTPASSLESTSSTAFVVASPTTSTSTTPTVPVSSTSTSATVTPPNSLTLVSSSSSGSSVLGASSSSLSGSALSTAPLGTSIGTSLGGTSTELLESNKSTTTVTTDAGEVIPTVTPPPVVVPPPVVTPPVDNTLPVVRWDKFNPVTPVGDSTTLGDQVSSQYEQLIAGTVAGDFIIERQKGASPTLAEQGDVSFALGSYEANVRNADTGEQVAATLGDATLTVNSAQQTFGTGFTLNSSLYNGTVNATGTYSATDGILTDDRTNPQMTIQGAVGSLGDATDAAYKFNYQIDPQLSADGALNWTGTVVAPAAPVVGATVGN